MGAEALVSRMTGRSRGPAGSRLSAARPGEVIDRDRSFSFTWEGAQYRAFEGDTITSRRLTASGVRVLSRSFKYHRPRGILGASFHDPGCTVQIGDEPNVPRRAPAGRPWNGREVAEFVAFAAIWTSARRTRW